VTLRLAELSVLKRIGDTLRANYEAMAKQPAPERWVDLINHLDDEERAQRERQDVATMRYKKNNTHTSNRIEGTSQ
jgi:Anti-sigma factor NepR